MSSKWLISQMVMYNTSKRYLKRINFYSIFPLFFRKMLHFSIVFSISLISKCILFYCCYYYYALFSSMFILHFVYHCLWYVIHVHCLCYVIHVLFYKLISYICVCKLIAHKQLCSYFIDFLNAISIPQGGFLTKYYDNG